MIYNEINIDITFVMQAAPKKVCRLPTKKPDLGETLLTK